MSTTRWPKAGYPKDAQGRLLCRCGCGRLPLPPRIQWFSNKCSQDYIDSRNHHTIRRKLLERDKGLCALCGCDCEAEFGKALESFKICTDVGDKAGAKALSKLWKMKSKSGWEADHIIPVAEGGGGCGISGFRILCHPCHKSETSRLATRRASKTSPP